MDVTNIHGPANKILQQMQQLISRSGGEQIAAEVEVTNDFATLLKDAISKVNSLQQQEQGLQKSYAISDPNVSIAQVMLASKKAGLAFQTVLQVRNKLLTAYHDILNMSI